MGFEFDLKHEAVTTP